MHHPVLSRKVLLPLALLLTAAVPLAAQTSAPAGTEEALAKRMRAFLLEIPDEPNKALTAFFPRRGDWTWVQTIRDYEGGGRPRIGVWRFPAAQTQRAIGHEGPVCDSFDEPRGEFGPREGRFGMQARVHRWPWRRVRGNRFVPPGAPADAPLFVEWRREDGEWVVSAFGDEDIYFPRLLGRQSGPFSRDTTLAPEGDAFAPADWYTIVLEGRRSPKYGVPRPMERDSLTRVGVYRGVSVYVARGESWDTAEILYLPVSPGRFQVYERPQPFPCD